MSQVEVCGQESRKGSHSIWSSDDHGQLIPISVLASCEKVTVIFEGRRWIAVRGLSHVLLPVVKPKLLVLLESLTHRISTEWQGLND